MAWIVEHGNEGVNTDTLFGPVSPIPRAIVDDKGLPYTGSKSTTTTYLQARYKTLHVVTSALPQGWVPEVAILEGMKYPQFPQ